MLCESLCNPRGRDGGEGGEGGGKGGEKWKEENGDTRVYKVLEAEKCTEYWEIYLEKCSLLYVN